MSGIIGQKMDMTRIVQNDVFVPVTLVKVPKLRVEQVKTQDIDGYSAIVVSAMKSDTKEALRREFPISDESAFNKGDEITLDALEGVDSVRITGTSKGKGFAGAMKRWNFSGGPGRVGSKFHRALGSIGTRKPRRTKPGKRMHGHYGVDTKTLRSVPVVHVDKENSVIALKGPVPGARNSYFLLQF